MSRLESMQKFLGDVDPALGAFGLLGLTPEACDEALVVASLHARLARVAGHPLADSPEAQEVKLALHAAAAQLMDAASRAAAAQALRAQGSAGGGRRSETVDPALLRDVRVLLGAFGGMNPDSHRRLTMLAQSKGIPQEQMQRALAALSTPTDVEPAPQVKQGERTGLPRGGLSQTEWRNEPLPDQVDPGYAVMDRAIKFAAATVLGMCLIVAVLYFALKPGKPPVAPPGPTPAAGPTAKSPGAAPKELFPQAKSPSTVEPAKSEENKDLAGKLEAMAGESHKPANAAAFMTRVDELLTGWFTLGPDQIAKLQDACVEFVYRMTPAEAALAVDEMHKRARWMEESATTPSPRQISDGAATAGLLNRLSREESLPPDLRHRLDSTLGQLFEQGRRPEEQTFAAGAQGSLRVAADRLAARWNTSAAGEVSASSWERWAAAANACERGGKHRMTLGMIETLLASAPDPTQNKLAFDSIGLMIATIDVNQDPEAKVWILRWLVAPGIDAAHLFALTSRCAENPTRSGGIDHTLVVPSSASERVRAELRERYAKVWGMADVAESDKVRADWISAAKTALALSPSGTSISERVDFLLLWSKFNESASLLWGGSQAEAASEVAAAASTVVLAPSTTVSESYHVTRPTDDGNFGARYFSLSVAERVRLVQEAFRNEEIGPRDALAVVTEFSHASSTPLRSALHELIKRRGHDAFMLRALLELSPTFPRTKEVTDIVADITGAKLPSSDHPLWRLEIRRALVETNLASVARGRDFAQVDSAAEALAASYAARLGTAGGTQLTAEDAAERLYDRWKQQARSLITSGREPWTFDQMERRANLRRTQAQGIVQRFVAAQESLAEAAAYIIANESPARADEVKQLVEQAERDVSARDSVLAQAEAMEKALTRLWLVRLSEQEGVTGK